MTDKCRVEIDTRAYHMNEGREISDDKRSDMRERLNLKMTDEEVDLKIMEYELWE